MPDNNENLSVQQQLDELRKRAMSEIHSNRKKLDEIVPASARKEDKDPDAESRKDSKPKKKEQKPEADGSILVKKEASASKKPEKEKKPEAEELPDDEIQRGPEIVPIKNGVSVLTRQTPKQEGGSLEEAPVLTKADDGATKQEKQEEVIDDGFEDDLDELFGPEETPKAEEKPVIEERPVIEEKTEEPVITPKEPASKDTEAELDELFGPDKGGQEKGEEAKAAEDELDAIFAEDAQPKEPVVKTEDEELDDIFSGEPEKEPKPQKKEEPQKKQKEKREEPPAPTPAEPAASVPEPAPEPKKKTGSARHKGPHSIRTRKVLYVDMEGRELSGFKLLDRSTGRTFELENKKTTVGRDASNDIMLSSNYVSGKHAVITQKEGFFFVEDLGSKNGTMLNNNKIEKEERLAPGDKITFGDVATLFTAEAMQDEDGPEKQPAEKKVAELTLVRKDTGEAYEIFDNMTIGRDASNDITIPEPEGHYVSARHAVLTLDGKKVRLKDMDSSNGTFIGNNRIKSKTIYKGNIIKIADIEFEVV